MSTDYRQPEERETVPNKTDSSGPFMIKKPVEITVALTVCRFNQFDAQTELAHELRRIADKVEEGNTVGESGAFCNADWGKWDITTPFDDAVNNGANNL